MHLKSMSSNSSTAPSSSNSRRVQAAATAAWSISAARHPSVIRAKLYQPLRLTLVEVAVLSPSFADVEASIGLMRRLHMDVEVPDVNTPALIAAVAHLVVQYLAPRVQRKCLAQPALLEHSDRSPQIVSNYGELLVHIWNTGKYSWGDLLPAVISML